MTRRDRWLLPEGVEEVLPQDAWRLESLRRSILDLFRGWGYELVMPPLIEFLDSLLTGVGTDLELQTFKVTDLLSGRLMGIRPDMTPQAARIDAHYLKREVPVRLCYLGPVLRTRAEEFGASREPLQLGAELFGHGGPESAAEVLALMITTLRLAGIDGPHIDLGHVGVFRALADQAGLAPEQEGVLFEALQRKAAPEVEQLTAALPSAPARMMRALLELNGDSAVIAGARTALAQAPDAVHRALDELETVARVAGRHAPALPLYFDLAELTGYYYYTGVVFSAFVPGHGRAVARGGRYDGIGKAFGRARPATGFGADLRLLARLSPAAAPASAGVLAPYDEADAGLQAEIARLRAAGERVIVRLPGVAASAPEMGCDRELARRGEKWIVINSKK